MFYLGRKRIFDFFFLMGKWLFWKLENVLSPEGSQLAEPNGVHLTVFPFYCIPETSFGIFVSMAEIRPWNLKNVLSSEGTLRKQNPNGVHLIFSSFYCVYRRVFETLNLRPEIRLFENLKMFYPPKGHCQSRARMGSDWFFSYVLIK